MLKPSARPRSAAGKTAVTMAALVVSISALPTAWNTRAPIRNGPFNDKADGDREETEQQVAEPVGEEEAVPLAPARRRG